jgi:Cu-Zn family superoxide dismutase
MALFHSSGFRGAAAIAGLVVSAGVLADAHGMKASATIIGCENKKIEGIATLVEQTTPEGIKEVTVEMRVTGLTDGKHAVHIHEVGACEPCGAAGGHHDPGPYGESRPDSAGDDAPAKDINHPYHMGDLINLDVKEGLGVMKHTTNRVTLSPGRLSILDENGSAFIIHTNPDTYCDHESDLKKGCAGGSRDACGIIRASGDATYPSEGEDT